MKASILERLERLENAAHNLIENLFPSDDDGFCQALAGDQAENFKRGDGYDVLQCLNSTARSDWADYEISVDAPESNE